MRPRAIHTEDSQPNEIRLARKGNERVPTVRSSRGGFRGAPQVRGRPPYHSTNHQQRPQNHNYYQGRNNTTQHNFQRPHKHFTDIPPRAADSFKRPRFDNLNGSRGGERPSSNTHSHASSSAQMNKASRQIQIVAELPDTCWRGVFGSHNAREEWLRIEIPRIEQTRHVSVYGHFFMDRMVRFNCYTGPDDSNRTEEIRNGSGSSLAASPQDFRNPAHAPKSGLLESLTTYAKHSQDTPSHTSYAHNGNNAASPTVPDASFNAHKQLSPPSATNPTHSIDSTHTPFTSVFHNRARPIPHRPPNPDADTYQTDHLSSSRLDTTEAPHATSDTSRLRSPQLRDRRYPQNVFRSGKLTVAPYHSSPSPSPPPEPAIHCSPVINPPSPEKRAMTPIVIDTSDSDDPLACVVAPRRKKYNKHDPNSGPRDDEDASADQHLPAPRPQSHLLRPLDSSDKALGSTRLREYLSRPTSADPILLRESHRESPIPDMLAGSSNSTRNSDVNRAAHMALAMDSEIYRIPNRSHDRPRRILFEPHDASALTISRHGYIDRFDSNPFRYNQLLRSPAHPSLEVVEDACFLTISGRSVIVLAHARDEKQITIASLGHGRYANIHFLERPSSSVKKGGASAVAAMMQPRMFASGGHDHAVHLWTLSDDLRSAEPRLLAMRHTALVQSLLAIRDTSHKLISAGADCNVHLWDLSSERVVNTIKASNSVYHVHKTPSPFCTLLEVAHRELQFEVRDHRLVPENPVQRFGYRTDTVHGRFIKGDSQSHLFACGDREGTIRLWDLRNTNGTPATIDCFQGQKVAHCVFTQSKLLGCSEDRQFASVKYFSVD